MKEDNHDSAAIKKLRHLWTDENLHMKSENAPLQGVCLQYPRIWVGSMQDNHDSGSSTQRRNLENGEGGRKTVHEESSKDKTFDVVI